MNRAYRIDEKLKSLAEIKKAATESWSLAREVRKLFEALNKHGLLGHVIKESPEILDLVEGLGKKPLDVEAWYRLLEVTGRAVVKIKLGLNCEKIRVRSSLIEDLIEMEIRQEVLDVLRRLRENEVVEGKLCQLVEGLTVKSLLNGIAEVLDRLSKVYDKSLAKCYDYFLDKLSQYVITYDIKVLPEEIGRVFGLKDLDSIVGYGVTESRQEVLVNKCKALQELKWNTFKYLTKLLCNDALKLYKELLERCICVESPNSFLQKVVGILKKTSTQIKVLSGLAEKFEELKPVVKRLEGFRADGIPKLIELLETLRELDELPKPRELDELLGLLLEHYKDGAVDLGELYPKLQERGLVGLLLDTCSKGLLRCTVVLS